MLFLNKIFYFTTYKLWLFNFNKCCIWIVRLSDPSVLTPDLTLTSVVFEFNCFSVTSLCLHHLTLTSVVFELVMIVYHCGDDSHLTLTSVVFE